MTLSKILWIINLCIQAKERFTKLTSSGWWMTSPGWCYLQSCRQNDTAVLTDWVVQWINRWEPEEERPFKIRTYKSLSYMISFFPRINLQGQAVLHRGTLHAQFTLWAVKTDQPAPRATDSHREHQHHRNTFPSICVETSIKLPVGHSGKVKIIYLLQSASKVNGWNHFSISRQTVY